MHQVFDKVEGVGLTGVELLDSDDFMTRIILALVLFQEGQSEP
jgi:hypothetical protein